mmetsp:Transcript_149353/g.416275  ORF Transcript_149353/g.416275 Transcript_149353/m.416275 type:complete len:218 (-) Transcript_149353:113-766(-)
MALPEHAWSCKCQDNDLDTCHVLDRPIGVQSVDGVQDLTVDHEMLPEAPSLRPFPVAHLQRWASFAVGRVFAKPVHDVVLLHCVIDGEDNVNGPLVFGHLPEVHVVGVFRLPLWPVLCPVHHDLFGTFVNESGHLIFLLFWDATLGDHRHVVDAISDGLPIHIDDSWSCRQHLCRAPAPPADSCCCTAGECKPCEAGRINLQRPQSNAGHSTAAKQC